MLRVLFPGRDSSLGTYIILTILENINLFFIAISFLKKNEIHQSLSQAVHCMNQRDANNLLNKLIPTKNSPTVNHKIHLQKN